MKPRPSPAAKVASQLSRLSIAAPQVVAHRVGRMATAGPVLSARDKKEFAGMVLEKQRASAQALQSMWLAGSSAQRDLMLAFTRSMFQPFWAWPSSGAKLVKRAQSAGWSTLSQGLGPIEKKASSNAKRLNRGKKT